jgi:heptosyltransferase-2
MRKRSVAEIQQLTAAPAASQASASPHAANHSVHQVYDYLHLVGALGACAEIVPPLLCVSAQEMDHVRQKYFVGGHAALTKPGAVIIGLNPGAEYGPAKRWPVERYVEIAIGLRRSYPQAGLVVFGGKSELETGERIVSAAGVNGINLAGKTSLRELMALLKASTVLITNDTGPMHVAAALGTPVVGIYGSTSPELTAPGKPGQFPGRVVRSNVPCAPCFRRECPIDFRCMDQITSNQVLTAVRAVMAASTPSSRGGDGSSPSIRASE